MVHTALFAGKPADVLLHASQLDRWLSAHLADIMEPLSLISDPSRDEISIRDQFVLAYAEYLYSDPALWRITVDYMYSYEVLIRVTLRLNDKSSASHGGDEEKIRAGNVVGVLKDSARRTVCRIAAQTLVREKDYGLAVSYCSSAEDWQGLGHVVDRVLDEYITSGK
ncbi:hypothetical protein B0H14DRAFT_3094264 [Mycena olivaceomarginata]|nr:hypothetical protein B0H14DRAFT_3094264 [Mycena olivaceomarginata]